MFKLAVVRFKNDGTAKGRVCFSHLHYKTFKGVCRALRSFSWDFSIDHFEVYFFGDVEHMFFISNRYEFEKDFLYFKSYFIKREVA